MTSALLWITVALSTWFDASQGPADAAGASAGDANPRFPAFKVTRTGRAFGHGDSVPFPARKTKGVAFAASILEGKSRDDGYLDTARSADGRKLWVEHGTDDGDVSTVRFEVEGSTPLPARAVLQMVDGFTSPDPGGEPGGLGSAAFKRGSEIRKQHYEAWLALPGERAIVRPTDQARFPLVATTGKYDETQAARAQWVVFVSRCEEVKGPCVYYGPPAAACGRSSKLKEADGLLIYPAKCR